MATQRRFEVMGEDIFKIAEKIMKNQKFLKLLKFTDADPLGHPDLTQEEIDEMLHKNILIVPKIPDELDEKTCYVVVILNSYDVVPANQDFKAASIRFDVVCPMDRWVINAKTLRPYLMMSEIDAMFNEQAVAGIGNLAFSKAVPVVLSPQLAGYSMLYEHYEFN